MFVVAGAMAFATGTSWGSFGILLPIAGSIMNTLAEPDLLLPALGAVLAGAMLGDHISPISDTTILSATGLRVQRHHPRRHPAAVRAAVGRRRAPRLRRVRADRLHWLGLVVALAATTALLLSARALATPLPEAERTAA